MAKVTVHIVRQTIVEHVYGGVIEVDSDTLRNLTERPLQAKYWAENVLPYTLEAGEWRPIGDGRPSVGFDVKHIEINDGREWPQEGG